MNRGTNAAPTAGQSNPYTLLSYNTNGLQSQRDRRHDNGLRQVYDFLWDGSDRLRQVDEAGVKRFSGLYNGDGIRVRKEDTRGALGLQLHDYSYGPLGLLWESNPNTVYTPGFGHRSNGINKFYRPDWLGSTPHCLQAVYTLHRVNTSRSVIPQSGLTRGDLVVCVAGSAVPPA